MNSHLSSLARTYPHTKFLRALASELEFAVGSEREVLPTLLVYKDGDVSEALVGFDRELRDANGGSTGWSREVVEEVLIR